MRQLATTLLLLLLVVAAPPVVSETGEDRRHQRIAYLKTSVRPLDSLNEAFRGSAQWRGSDCAYSFPIGKDRSLWLFGDTVIHAQNSNDVMINNTAAWLDQTAPGELSMMFYWKIKNGEPASVLKPEQPDEWYWPGDGIVHDGKLWILMKRVRRAAKAGPEESQFDWYADDLLCLEPAEGDPTQWKSTTCAVPEHGRTLFGTACASDKEYMYVYCSAGKLASGLDAHPAIVARTAKSSLPYSSASDWTYWSKTRNAWVDSQDDATILFPDAAPEMTVSYIPYLRQYAAIYMPPLSDKILMRTATKPEGPFSDPILIYRAPEAQIKLDGKAVGVYSAKAHPELTDPRSDQLIVTYCSNPGGLKEHGMRPDLYFPHALRIHFNRHLSLDVPAY